MKHHKLKSVLHFKYLGSIITQDNNLNMEIHCTWILIGNRCYYDLGSMLASKVYLKILEIKLYMTLILPVVLCGSETLTPKKVGGTRLTVFETFKKRIYGPCIDFETGNGG